MHTTKRDGKYREEKQKKDVLDYTLLLIVLCVSTTMADKMPLDPYGDEDQNHLMNRHPYGNRSPSPANPFTGYQLSDNPYAPQGHLEMPSTDRLAEQPTVSAVREGWRMTRRL